MFPALRQAWRDVRAGFGDQPLSLKANISFDGANVDWYARNGYSKLYNLLGGGPSHSGETVTVDSALNHSVVWACTRIISESVAFMPLALMQATSNGKFPASTKPLYQALHNAPNDDMTAMTFRETLTAHVVTRGNCYAQIARRSGTGEAMELYPLLPTQVTPDRDKQNRLVYVDSANRKTYTVERGRPHDILHVRGLGYDGLQGYSVITMARHSIGTAQALEKYVGTFHANGGRVPYILKHPQRFKNDKEFEKFRSDWEQTYSEPHKAPILEGGLEYEQIGMSPEDSQLLTTRQFTIPELCRWFLISPHLVGDLSRATFSNIEQLALEFVKMTLTAWITRWEQDLWRCLLTPDEKSSGYFFKHNVNGLLRGDFSSRMAGYASALQNGHLSINEVRDLEDRNPVEGGDQHFVQLNMQDVNQVGATVPRRVPVSNQQGASA